MFDINLLRDPGLLGDNKITSRHQHIRDNSLSISKSFSIDSELTKNNMKNRKTYLLSLISTALFFLILGTILHHNKIDQKHISSMNIPIHKLLDALQENNLYTYVNYMNFTNERIFLEIDVLNENIFYYLLDELGNDFNKEITGVHKANKFSIVGEFPWSIKEDKDFTINLLNKELSDFNLDIKKEIYNDKLIVICGIQGVFQLLHLIADLNLIDRFYIELKEIQSLPEQMGLFQIIIN